MGRGWIKKLQRPSRARKGEVLRRAELSAKALTPLRSRFGYWYATVMPALIEDPA